MRLDEIFEYSNKALESEDLAREEALILAREAIQLSSYSIRAIHRGEEENAENLLEKARRVLLKAQERLAPHPKIYYSGFLQDAEKEVAEASITISLILNKPLPSPTEMSIGIAPYLNGLGEAVGEMRRHVLDLIRIDNLDRAESILETMDEIYFILNSLDYPSAITGNLKRTNDMVRGVIERTRGDLTSAISRKSLEKSLEQFLKTITES